MNVANLVTSFLVGTVGAGIAGAIIKKRFDVELDVWRSQRGWKEMSVSQLLGPVYLQLARTKRAFDRWNKKNPYLEGDVIRAGNVAIRDLLLEKPHLIPPALREAATELVVHYDVWLEEFERWRGKREQETGPEFVFAGPQGFPFPWEAERAFVETFERYWQDLYAADIARGKKEN